MPKFQKSRGIIFDVPETIWNELKELKCPACRSRQDCDVLEDENGIIDTECLRDLVESLKDGVLDQEIAEFIIDFELEMGGLEGRPVHNEYIFVIGGEKYTAVSYGMQSSEESLGFSQLVYKNDKEVEDQSAEREETKPYRSAHLDLDHIQGPKGDSLSVLCPHCDKEFLMTFSGLEGDPDYIEVAWGKNREEMERNQKEQDDDWGDEEE